MFFAIFIWFSVFLQADVVFSYILSNHISQDHNQCWNGIKDFYVVCYYNDWSNHRLEKGQFGPKDVNGAPCTHVIYAFANLKEDTLDAFVPDDSKKAIEEGFYRQLTNQKHDNLKVMLGVGGWGDSTPKYSKMLEDPQLRAKVVKQVTELLIEWNFDGLDVAIDFPNAYQGELNSGSPEDKPNFIQFLRELRQTFDAKTAQLNGKDKLLLSVAVSANEKFMDVSYDVPSLAEISDWIGVLSYNFHGMWDTKTGIMAPFTVQPGDQGAFLKFNLQSAMNMWLTKGAPADKLIAGFSSFGRSFVLTDKASNIINSPADGIPEPAEFTRYKTAGVMAFYEVIDSVRKRDWTSVHMNYLGSYAYKENQWVGYDDVFDVAVKASYVKLNCFRGISFWSLDLDCFQADCPTGKYPLIRTANDVLKDVKTLSDVRNLT